MAIPPQVIYRRKTLTNSAAEFVETRGGQEIAPALGEQFDEIYNLFDKTEFSPEVGQFVPKGIVFK